MTFATDKDVERVYNIMRSYKTIFPHIRTDYVKRMIQRKKCIFKHGVVITFNKYKRKQKIGSLYAKKGDWVLHQIASERIGNIKTRGVVEDFLNYVDGDLWLTVRCSNTRAKKFYERMGMKRICGITWAKGKIKGDVYKLVKRER